MAFLKWHLSFNVGQEEVMVEGVKTCTLIVQAGRMAKYPS